MIARLVDGYLYLISYFWFLCCRLAQVSDRTFKSMTDHVMGGKKILPGTFFVEMAVEALGLPCALVDVNFKTMSTIPRATADESPANVLLQIGDASDDGRVDGMRPFTVKSVPLRVAHDTTEVVLSDHAGGYATQLQDTEVRSAGYLPGAFGHLTPCDLKDIGRDGM